MGHTLAQKQKPIYLLFFPKEYTAGNMLVGSTQCFLQGNKLPWDLRSLRQAKPMFSERVIVKEELRAFSMSHCLHQGLPQVQLTFNFSKGESDYPHSKQTWSDEKPTLEKL